MLTTYFLFIQLMINGVWVDGSTVFGWSSRLVETYALCEQRKDTANSYGAWLLEHKYTIPSEKGDITSIRAECRPQ